MKKPKQTPGSAKERFVALLEDHRRALKRSSSESKGPNKLLAERIRVSPTRVAEFLRADWTLPIDESRFKARDQLRKIVLGFAASVERALRWLSTEHIADNGVTDLDATEVVRGYWPSAFLDAFHSSDVQRAIADGRELATSAFTKITKIHIELWISDWGPFGATPDIKENSFFVRYGYAIFRNIDPLGTYIQPIKKPLSEILSGLPVRTTHGDWAVAAGPYATLERRFHRAEFVTFPAIRYPLIGLLISHESDNITATITFDFDLLRDCAPYKSPLPGRSIGEPEVAHLIAQSFPYPRVVAKTDDAAQKFLESLSVTFDILQTHEQADTVSVVNALLPYFEEHKSPIVFVADGTLAYEVYRRFPERDRNKQKISMQVISQDLQYAEFSFLSGIMFREEDRNLNALIEHSQKQLFRTPHRVAALLETFVCEIDTWLEKTRAGFIANREWPKHVPVFIYPCNEVTEYLVESYGKAYRPEPKNTWYETCTKTAKAIYHQLWETPGVRALKHQDQVSAIFLTDNE